MQAVRSINNKSNQLKVKLDDLRVIEPLTENQKRFFNIYDRSSIMVLHGCAGTGKTFISLYKAFLDIFLKNTRYKKVVIIRSAVPSRDIGFLPGDEEEKSDAYQKPYVNICTELFNKQEAYQRLKEQHIVEFELTSYLRGTTFNNSVVVVDECFPPNTEVLTDKGYVYFEKLTDEHKIAQITDDNRIEYVTPLRIINKEYDGKMVSIYKDRFRLTTTENHDLVMVDSFGEYKQKAKDEIKTNSNFKTSLPYEHNDYDLDDISKSSISYLCALQADGSYCTTTQSNDIEFNYWMISFKRKDKIDKFREILSKLNIEYTEYAPNKKGIVRFYLGKQYPLGMLPGKDKFFDSSYILAQTKEWHRYFTSELIFWDGSSKGKTLLYCNTNKHNIDIAQTIGHLVGYRCRVIVSEDKRDIFKNKPKTYYRLTFVPTTTVSLQGHKKEVTNYKGNVYCVEVPSGKIMVRQNGNIFITGNCQNMNFAELNTIMTRVGSNTKIIFCGDFRQTDLNKKNDTSGLAKFISICKLMRSYKNVEFDVDDIVRSSIVKEFIIATLDYEDRTVGK